LFSSNHEPGVKRLRVFQFQEAAKSAVASEKEKIIIAEILAAAGFRVGAGQLPRPGICAKALCDSSYAAEICQLYRNLGGAQPQPPDKCRGWDIETERFAVEVDEQQHFNRYRFLTLQSSLYRQLRPFPLARYCQFCVDYEKRCPRSVGWWSKPRAEKQFGKSDPPGVFGPRGSARWKQRAFYDTMRDAVILVMKVPVVRISIWDELTASGATRTVRQALSARTTEVDGAIVAMIEERLGLARPK